jgi:4-amino-4-deoxy-L-arabinose transferase-like glycosyltransferase
MTRADYAHFQVITTALCSLAYLPIALLAGRFAGRPASRIAAAVLMVNPLFLQNATYPWTKLQAVFFVLAGLYFFLRARDPGANLQVCAALFALSMGAAVVTHYSSGPYVVVLGIAWLTGGRQGWSRPFVRTTAASAALGACVIAPWVVWSVGQFGWHGTFLSNSTTTMLQRTPGNPLITMALNLRDSLVPPQVRGFKGTLLIQTSPWGMLRDQFFVVYQLNPLLALGCVGWLATAREALRAARGAQPRERMFWALTLAGVVALSMAAFGDRDHYGTGHICLQSLVLCALAFLASRWDALGRGWRWALVAGWAVDFSLGIALQFAVEDFALDRLLTPGRSLAEVSKTYTLVSQENLIEKFETHLSFFADNLQTSPVIVLALLGAIFCMALARVAQAPADPSRP